MKIEHVAMYVNDLEGARNFFETYFGAVSNSGYHNQKTDFRSYFLSFGDGARLELMGSTGADRVYPSGILRRQQRGGGQPDRAADAGRL